MNLKKHNMPVDWRMSDQQVSEVSDVVSHLIRIAKALARDLGETSPDAFYFYLGPAVMWRNANTDPLLRDCPVELERITLIAEGKS